MRAVRDVPRGDPLERGAAAGVRGDPGRRHWPLGFEEGPVFPESYAYLERAGVEVVRGLCRDEGKKPFERYKELGGLVYNP